MKNMSSKLTGATIFGYSIGQLGVSIPLNAVGIYMLFFFTNVVGINPAFAGTILLIATIWAAVVDPFIGSISDNIRTKYGRRRPVILATMAPLAITFTLLFTSVAFDSDAVRNGYYVLIALLFYTFVTFIDVSFYSMGAEISQDFDTRTKIRVISTIFSYGSVIIAVNIPNRIIAFVENRGGSAETGWALSYALLGIIIITSLLISWRTSRGRELVVGSKREIGVVKNNIFKAMFETLKLRPVRFIIFANFFALFGYCLTSAVKVYVLTYVGGVEPTTQSLILSILPVATLIWLPLIGKLSLLWGKKRAFIIGVGFNVVTLLVFYIIGIYTVASLSILEILFALGNGFFWTLCLAMAYDTAEVDEWLNNKRREGVLVAFMSLAQKLGAALSMWLSGFILEQTGYDAQAPAQTETTINGLISLYTWIPAILLAFSVVCVFRYPITKKKHEAMVKALKQRKEGEEYDTSEFSDLIN